jgi:hypothetical protein
MGTSGSYTDFHLDFGGTSVWYHVLWGHKTFYLVPPDLECFEVSHVPRALQPLIFPGILKRFKGWLCSETQDDIFFGDLVPGQCFCVDVLPGQTLIIPSGWIHAVFTPEDSLVFGGNFLHSLSILRQLQVYALETKTHITKKYRFPCFREMHFHALACLLCLVRSDQGIDTKYDQDTDDERIDIDRVTEVTMLCPRVYSQIPILLKCCSFWVSSYVLSVEELVSALLDRFISVCRG